MTRTSYTRGKKSGLGKTDRDYDRDTVQKHVQAALFIRGGYVPTEYREYQVQ